MLLATPGFEALCRRATAGHVRCLMYHRFSPTADRLLDLVDPDTLRRQLEWILEHHALWSPEEHLDSLGERRRARRAPVVLTVDDGYADLYEVAFPIFREFGVPVTAYLTTAFVDGSIWMWWDRLWWALERAPAQSRDVDVLGVVLTIDTTTPEGRKQAWNDVADRCRFASHADKQEFLDRVERLLEVEVPSSPGPGYRSVNWDQVGEMAAAGIRFGAHTEGHVLLSRVPASRARHEIETSRRRVQERVGDVSDVFCTPQGGPADYTAEVLDLIRDAGFSGNYLGFPNFASASPFEMPRYSVSADMLEFRWKLCGAEYLMYGLRKGVGRPAPLEGESYWSGSH
jgi:peptidoglycan/xylan/chitin deacetylase (PgdA/CDA1 family)